MKKLLSLVFVAVMIASLAAATVTTGGATADPSASYVVQTAPNEDSDIRMWFQHANVKVHQEDKTSTGRNTYSVYMAKNEYQGTQVTLYSPSVTKSLITAEIGSFTAMDGSGATMTAELYYEFYIKCDNLDSTDVLGVNNASQSFIREGMIPDAMAPIGDINMQGGRGKFTLTAGKTQTLYIKIKSTLETPSGWYSAQFNVKNTSGQVVKTATVYAYVWDFEIPEATHLQTAVQLGYDKYNAANLYKNAYDYLLDNRLCAYEIPGGLTSSNADLSYYLENPRVNAIAVQNKTYSCQLLWPEIQTIYNLMSSRSDWNDIKDKFYFYYVDEPRSKQVHEVTQSQYFYDLHPPIEKMFQFHSSRVERGWPGATCLVTIDDNSPYVPGTSADGVSDYGYAKNLAWNGSRYLTADDGVGRFSGVMDTVQGIMDEGSTDIWCVKTQVFTPNSVLASSGYHGLYRVNKVMDINGQCSGFDYGNLAALYFDWDSIYGPFDQRFRNYQAERAAQGDNKKLWVYMCGKGPDYTYCNNLIENTGLQSELLLWQTMQNGATGFLYYSANMWPESSNTAGFAEGSSVAYDGSTVSGKWPVNRWTPTGVYNATAYPFGDPISQGTVGYGNGVLLYGKDMKTYLRVFGSTTPLGTVRVEHLRDGVEDYEMLYQYREAYGETAMQTLISKVSSNVVNYLSMPAFNRSSYPSSMTNEDVFASVRIELGNAVEAAAQTQPHEHTWDAGVVTTDPSCTEDGVKTYTCTECGETYTEAVPATGHTWNAGVVTVQPTYKTEGVRTYTCTKCGETYTEPIPVIPPKIGDVNGDGVTNMKDIQLLKKFVASTVTIDDIVDVNSDLDGDGSIGFKDLRLLKSSLAGS